MRVLLNVTTSGLFVDALGAAERSSIYKFHTGAAIYDKDGKLLSIGWSHVPPGRLSTTPWSKHAEHHAISRLAPDAVPHTIVIATITKKGNITLGRPCKHCMNKIHKAGIEEVIWTKRYTP